MSQTLDEKLGKMTKEEQGLWALRHTAEHVLHAAMQNLYPSLKKAMGPATPEGFYFDFDLEDKITEKDFPEIEKEMKRLIESDLPMKQEFVEAEEAKKLFKDNPYKLEWVEDITLRQAQGSKEKISVYKMGEEDLDLCSGPHAKSTGEIKAFKLLSVAGAYWHGDEKNKMLTRIYGTAFPSKEDLDKFEWQKEEAEKRDHKKLGQELGLFMFHETAPGMPYWLPKGVVLLNELVKFWREEHEKRGYKEIVSPLINKKELYVTSGHWDHYRENMFLAETDEGETYALKPMNCPNAMVVFASQTRSYRELPLRLGDTDTLHRFERSGTLNGLLRVREFRQDDAHIFVTKDQIKEEYRRILDITELFYSIFNISYRLRLGTRPDDFMGDPKIWDKAETELEEIMKENKLDYFIGEGEGAFYGPKIDIMMKDALGREWQTGTIQLDFQLPERFNLTYSAEDGTEKRPVVIHRVIYGSLERFIGILLEHLAGNLPVWLAPVQAKILPITERNVNYGQKVLKELKENGIRAEVDERNETLQAKIRDAQLEKVPYMVILGDREEKSSSLSLRLRNGKDGGTVSAEDFIKSLQEKVDSKSLE